MKISFAVKHRSPRIYHVGRKLYTLMLLEIVMLVISFFLCAFFFQKNKQMMQNNSIFQLNNTVLILSNSTMEKMTTISNFPLSRISHRYNDDLLSYLSETDHSDLSLINFRREFFQRTAELCAQFHNIESILLFTPDGTLLDEKTSINIYLPYKNYSTGNWYKQTTEMNGQIYFLSEEDTDYLGLSKTPNNLYASRIIHDPLTLNPLCITLIGIHASDIPLTFKSRRLFPEQDYGLFDSAGKQILGSNSLSLTLSELEESQRDHYTLTKTEAGKQWIYHISCSDEIIKIYAVTRTPYYKLLSQRYAELTLIIFIGILIITLNILIFGRIIQSINQPLSQLVNMCDEIGKGNFHIRIPCSHKDELSYLTASLNSMSEKIENLITEVYIKTLAKKDVELQMLRSQINPHFLYNTLENMRMSAYMYGNQELSQMCLLLSKTLRYGISSPSELVTVKEELDSLQIYTSLLHFCFPKLTVSIFVDEKIRNYSIIKVLFQPLIENSVNHAILGNTEAMTVHIWGYEEAKDLIFIVSDDGRGMEREQLEKIRNDLNDESSSQKGIGLKNIHRRINLYYGSEYGLFIDSCPEKGTSVTVRIPKTTDKISSGEKD